MSTAMEEGKSIQKKLNNLKRVQSIYKGEDHPEISWALHEVGKAYEEFGDYENELKFKKECLTMEKRLLIKPLLKDKHELKNMVKSLNNVGLAFGRNGDFKNELAYCLDALKIEKNFSKNKYDPEIASLLG